MHSHFRMLLALVLLNAPAAKAISIIVTYGQGGNAVPSGAQAIFNQVIANYDAEFSNVTLTGANTGSTGQVNIDVSFGSTNLGESSTNTVLVNYATWKNAMNADSTANLTNTPLAEGAASLPGTNPLPDSGPCTSLDKTGCVVLTSADARALGITQSNVVSGCINPSSNCNVLGPDSTITISNSQCYFDDTVDNPGGCGGGGYNAQDVFEHELDEALAVDSTLTGLANGASLPSNFAAEDYFRYTATTSCNTVTVPADTRCVSTTGSDNIYFSPDGGVTNVAQFFQNGSGADRNDWIYGSTSCDFTSQSGPYVQDAYACPGTTAPSIQLGNATPELTVLNTLGFNSVVVPEPSTWALAACALGLILLRRKRTA